MQCSNIGYLVEAKQARGAIWLGDHFRPIMGSASAHCSAPPQPQITTLQSFSRASHCFLLSFYNHLNRRWKQDISIDRCPLRLLTFDIDGDDGDGAYKRYWLVMSQGGGPARSTNHYWPPALPHYWRQHFVQHTTDYWQQTTKYQLGVHNAHTSTLLQLYCENDARGVRAPPQGGPALVLDCGVLGELPLGTVWILLDKLQCAM